MQSGGIQMELDRDNTRIVADLKNISHRYTSKKGASVQALSDVSLELRRDEVVALVGPSGCGKSTLLRVMADLVTPSSGTSVVSIDRIPVGLGGLSMMFQTPTLLDWRTVLGNVALPLTRRKLSPTEIKERCEALLVRVGLQDFMHRSPYELSGGMQQRVAIARALVSEPEVLLLDEPFGALDAITRDEMCLLLEGLVEERAMSVLLVTHSVSEAILLSDRIMVMSARPGRIIEEIPVPQSRPRSLTDKLSTESRDLEAHMLDLLAATLTANPPGNGQLN